jgi:uncharacterized lipoprotein YmbA
MTRITLVALLVSLAACAASPQPNFYTLDPVPPAATPVSEAAATPLIVAVSLPELLDRPQLVRSLGTGRIDVADTDRWAAPLDDLARRALARDLALRQPGRVVSADRAAGGAPPQVLTVAVDAFAADAAGQVTLEGRWFLTGAEGNGGAVSRPFHIGIPAADTSAAAVVQAMAAALAQLADEVPAE